MFFELIMQITAFEFFDTKPFLDRAFDLEPTDPMNADFEAVGLESIYLLHNLGTLAVAFVFYIVLVVFTKLILLCSHYRCNDYGQSLYKSLIWESLITLMIESYSMLALSCMINLRFMSWEALNIGTMSALSILVTVLLIALPPCYIWFISSNFDNLE